MKKIFYLLFFISILYVANNIMFYLESSDIPKIVNKEKRAIVVGATSGMGRQVARALAQDGYEVGLVGRRIKLLNSLKQEIKTKTYIKQIDISKIEVAKDQLQSLIKDMGGLDLIFISVTAQRDVVISGKGRKMSWDNSKKYIDVDLNGFWVSANVAIRQFEKQGYGHLVGVSSIGKIKGSPGCPEYSGAKAFIAKYLEGVRHTMIKKSLPIFVTEIIPGWVDVERKKYSDIKGHFWVSTAQEAACQIVQAIKDKKEKAYITKRWVLMGWILWLIPDWLYRMVQKYWWAK